MPFLSPNQQRQSTEGRPVADGLPTLVVTHQLQVERRTGKVCQSETDVLPLCHATNLFWQRKSKIVDCWQYGNKVADFIPWF